MKEIRAVIFDWAGTTVDYGSIAPMKCFIDSFRGAGIEITGEMARKPMGLAKLDHIRAISAMLEKPLSESEIQDTYAVFEAAMAANVGNYCDVLDHAADTVAALRARGIKIGSTTGYTSAIMSLVLPAAKAQGYAPDLCVTPDQAGKGRPYPYMIWENMKAFGLVDPREVVKVGDTAADIEEGKNAGCWTVGVVLGSSTMGLSREEAAALSAQRLAAEKKRVREVYYQAGADFIIDDLGGLESVVDRINLLLAQSAPHKLLTPGPLTTRDAVKRAMLTDHCTWDDEYKAITRSVMRDITAICADDDYAAVLLQGSGTYAVESMINYLTEKKEKILFLVNGEYGRRMMTIASRSEKTFAALSFDDTQPVDPRALETRLQQDGEIKTVAVVHCETTAGVINPLEELAKVTKKYGKKFLVDAMSSFAAYEIDMPALGIDALSSSANKCLEGVPGLSFVVAKKSLLEASRGNSQSLCLDLYDQYRSLSENGGKFRFTSPTHVLLALRRALDEYRKEGGLPARHERYRKNHDLLTQGLAELGIRPIVAPENQSCIITTFGLGSLDFAGFYSALKSEGFIIYPGKLTSVPTFRLGNIGDLYPSDMEALVQAIGGYIRSQAAADGPRETAELG